MDIPDMEQLELPLWPEGTTTIIFFFIAKSNSLENKDKTVSLFSIISKGKHSILMLYVSLSDNILSILNSMSDTNPLPILLKAFIQYKLLFSATPLNIPLDK